MPLYRCKPPLALFRLFGVFALTLCCAAAFAEDSAFRENTDLPGNDIFRKADADITRESCLKLCEANPHCRAWTLVKDRSQGPHNVCYLKGQVAQPVARSCCDSGVKATAVLAPRAAQLSVNPARIPVAKTPAVEPPQGSGIALRSHTLRARGDPKAGMQTMPPVSLRSAPLRARGAPATGAPAPFAPVRITTSTLHARGVAP